MGSISKTDQFSTGSISKTDQFPTGSISKTDKFPTSSILKTNQFSTGFFMSHVSNGLDFESVGAGFAFYKEGSKREVLKTITTCRANPRQIPTDLYPNLYLI